MRIFICVFLALSVVGCVSQTTRDALDEAGQAYDRIRQDPLVMRNAPQDLARAADSLERSRRLSRYWGSTADAIHFAYLSKRYSEIAEAHGRLAANQQWIEQRERQLDSLRQVYEKLPGRSDMLE